MHNRSSAMVYCACCALLLAAAPARGDDEGIHIASDRTTSFMWNVSDGQGFRWDISNNGTVSDGTNDAYDGGMQLQVFAESFPGYSTARVSKDGTEIEVGPWQNRGLAISRRIFVNTKAGYCRWIDIFENPSSSEMSISVRYYSNMGDTTYRVQTTSGGADLAEKDWGAVTAGQGDTSRPAVVHVFAAPESKAKPRFQFTRGGNDELYYTMTLKAPAGKAVALCFFEAQRTGFDAGGKFLKDFQPQRELQGLPAALRKIIVNMTGAASILGGVELKRSEEADVVVLRNGDEILGTILNAQFPLRASFGELKIPAKDVVGMMGVSADSNLVHMALAGGQVVGGELAGDVTVKLSGGTELNIPAKGLIQAAYRVTPAKPADIAITASLVALRSGEQLAIDDSGMTLEFLTAQGALSLSAGQLQTIETDTPGGGLHRATFTNGSVLAGLLTAEKMPLKLKLGLPLEVTPAQVRRFYFVNPKAEPKDSAALTLRNADVLYGQLADQKWPVTSKFGNVSVLCRDIAEADFPADSLGQVRLTLRDGTKLGGQMAVDYINFKVEPGPAVKVFVGHLAGVKGGPAPAAPASAPATNPSGGNSPSPTPAPALAPSVEPSPPPPRPAPRSGGPVTRPATAAPPATATAEVKAEFLQNQLVKALKKAQEGRAAGQAALDNVKARLQDNPGDKQLQAEAAELARQLAALSAMTDELSKRIAVAAEKR